MKKILTLFFLFILCAGKVSPAITTKPIRILFVGNSLTYVNDLPSLVKEIGDKEGIIIIYKSISLPDYSLEDHLNEGNIETEIETGNYDYVVAQQGPSALPESQIILLRDARKLASICKENKTRLALYMVWPSGSRLFDLDNVVVSYKNAAVQTGSLLCPAGLAWKKAWEADKSLALYSADNFHPSIMGSLLAALTIYASLMNKTDLEFIKYETSSWKNGVSKSQFSVLKASALSSIPAKID